MTTFDDILTAARALSPGERLRLVDTIWKEVSPTDWQLPSTEWLTEAQRRSAEFDAGRMKDERGTPQGPIKTDWWNQGWISLTENENGDSIHCDNRRHAAAIILRLPKKTREE